MALQAGDCVEVFGLESDKGKELNGKRGILTKHLEAKGRFEVRLRPDRCVNVKPENLKKVELSVAERLRILGLGGADAKDDASPASASRPRSRSRERNPCPDSKPEVATPVVTETAPDLPFKPGHCVEVFGLESESGSQLNGQTGIVTQYVAEKKRFEVRLSEKTVSLKAENLRKREFNFGGLSEHQNGTDASKQESRSRSRSHDRKSGSNSSSSSSSSRSESPLRPEQVPEPFSLGDSVEILDLQSAEGQLLNGKVGTIATYLKGKSRFEVHVGAEKKVAHLKPANLRKCADSIAPAVSDPVAQQPKAPPTADPVAQQPQAPPTADPVAQQPKVPPPPAATSLSSLLGLGRVEKEVQAEPETWQSVWSRSGGGPMKSSGVVLTQEEIDTFNALQDQEDKRDDEINALRLQVKAELESAGAYCEEMFEQVFEERLKEHQLMKALRPQGESKADGKSASDGRRSASRSSSSSRSSSRSSARDEKKGE